MFAYSHKQPYKRKDLKSATNSEISLKENQDGMSWETESMV